MFKDLLDKGYEGWVVHLDADAYVHDLDYDLRAYLSDKADRAGVLTPAGGERYWDINNGVMMINLGNPVGQYVVRKWHRRYMDVPDDVLRALDHWPDDINDQTFLMLILDGDPHIRDSFFYQDRELLNHPYGTFIRQILRAYMPKQSDRLDVIKTAVAEVLGGKASDITSQMYPLMMSSLFRVLLHRDVDAGALDHYRHRFEQLGLDSGFRETLAEVLRSPEYLQKHGPTLPEPEDRVRAAYRWLLERQPTTDELHRDADYLRRHDWVALRRRIVGASDALEKRPG